MGGVYQNWVFPVLPIDMMIIRYHQLATLALLAPQDQPGRSQQKDREDVPGEPEGCPAGRRQPTANDASSTGVEAETEDNPEAR